VGPISVIDDDGAVTVTLRFSGIAADQFDSFKRGLVEALQVRLGPLGCTVADAAEVRPRHLRLVPHGS